MSLVAVKAVGLSDRDVVLLLLSLTVVAILMSFVWGFLADRIGPQLTLRAVLLSWAVGLVIGAASLSLNGTDPVTGKPVPTAIGLGLFVLAGAILGSGLGGVQVSDRVFMIRLSPPDRVGEFFGIYGLVGKASQVLGQLLYATIIFLFLDNLAHRRVPARRAQPHRHDARRAVAGVAGERPLGGLGGGRLAG